MTTRLFCEEKSFCRCYIHKHNGSLIRIVLLSASVEWRFVFLSNCTGAMSSEALPWPRIFANGGRESYFKNVFTARNEKTYDRETSGARRGIPAGLRNAVAGGGTSVRRRCHIGASANTNPLPMLCKWGQFDERLSSG